MDIWWYMTVCVHIYPHLQFCDWVSLKEVPIQKHSRRRYKRIKDQMWVFYGFLLSCLILQWKPLAACVSPSATVTLRLAPQLPALQTRSDPNLAKAMGAVDPKVKPPESTSWNRSCDITLHHWYRQFMAIYNPVQIRNLVRRLLQHLQAPQIARCPRKCRAIHGQVITWIWHAKNRILLKCAQIERERERCMCVNKHTQTYIQLDIGGNDKMAHLNQVPKVGTRHDCLKNGHQGCTQVGKDGTRIFMGSMIMTEIYWNINISD